MTPLATFVSPPGPCGYLPRETWSLQYQVVAEASAEDYERLLLGGWRRFGRAFFRPQCPTCRACESVRVPVRRFQPDRSQRRNRKRNEGKTVLQIGPPSIDDQKLNLYDRYHAFQTESIGWPAHRPKDAGDYAETFIDNPFPTEEWRYWLDGRLVGVGYVDALASGLSAIYFFYDPELREHGLGTWNVLSVIAEAERRGLPYAYLGYLVRGCRSSEYKSRFRPHELFDPVERIWKGHDGAFASGQGAQ
jgi:arginine-tRNA-protein transferase